MKTVEAMKEHLLLVGAHNANAQVQMSKAVRFLCERIDDLTAAVESLVKDFPADARGIAELVRQNADMRAEITELQDAVRSADIRNRSRIT